jgi:poly-gamma-glutamate synthesis protein (capsule biosynthesis protein)
MINHDIKILITGDLCPINRIEQLALSRNFEAIFNDFIDVFKGNDLNITDLECPLTISEAPRPKSGPYQKAHPDCIGVLKFAEIDVAVMANNHIMDYNAQGANDTVELCKSNNISTVGIGKNPEDAAAPFSSTIKGKRVAVLNFADNEFIAASDKSFMCNPVNPTKMYYDISDARRHHDYVIVIVHAGNEFYELPSPQTKRLYRYLIDIGADAVISHHTHAFSGYEIYNSRPIFYGLGNFIYDWPGRGNERWDFGYVVRLALSDKINFEIIPLRQGDKKAGIFHLKPDEVKGFKREIDRLNLIIADDTQLESEFLKYCNSVYPMYDSFIEPNFGRYITFLRKRGLFPRFLSKRKRLLLLNLARCDSHRDVLVRMLGKYE